MPATRYVFVHAHPDDETLSSGAIILGLAQQGDIPLVLTATRGERGEVTPALAARLSGADLADYREAERQQALTYLSAVDAGFLGQSPNRAPGMPERRYVDSGMTWLTPTVAGPAPDAPATALSQAGLAEVVADLVAGLEHWQADAVVSYDADGGYGHPDHVRCHDAARRAAHHCGLPFYVIVRLEPHQVPDAGLVWDATDQAALIAAHQSYPSQFTVHSDGYLTHVGGQVDQIQIRAGLRYVPAAT